MYTVYNTPEPDRTIPPVTRMASGESSTQSGLDGTIEVSFKDNLGIVTMRRGDNRFNEDFVEKMHAALDEVLRNPDVKAMVTTGNGKFYSNGLDLPWLAYLARTDPERLDTFTTLKYRSLFFRILTFPVPTITLLNGHAFAAGAMFAMAHDHVIMQNSRGWWCVNEVHLNLRFHPSMIEAFRLKIPKGGPFHEAVVLGRKFTGTEAKAAGIAHESCAPSEMYSRALNWVKKIVPANGFNREHLQTMKEDVYKSTIELKHASHATQFGSKM